MSLTPPPPPPPHRPASLGGCASACGTPKTGPGRRIAPGSPDAARPSPSQLRAILADITEQVANSPDASRRRSAGGIARVAGPVTRSRSMILSARTPRSSRAGTPMADGNENDSSGTRAGTPVDSPLEPAPGARRRTVAPLRYRALSTVSSITASPTMTSTSVGTAPREVRTSGGRQEPPPTLRLRPGSAHHHPPSSSSPIHPPPSSSSSSSSSANSVSSSSSVSMTLIHERRPIGHPHSPVCDDFQPNRSQEQCHENGEHGVAKRRRRNNGSGSGLGRL